MLPVRPRKQQSNEEQKRAPAWRLSTENSNGGGHRPRENHDEHSCSSLTPNQYASDANPHPSDETYSCKQNAATCEACGALQNSPKDREDSNNPAQSR